MVKIRIGIHAKLISAPITVLKGKHGSHGTWFTSIVGEEEVGEDAVEEVGDPTNEGTLGIVLSLFGILLNKPIRCFNSYT